MSDVTQLLHAIDAGEAQAAGKLLPLVYEELRKLAAAKMAREMSGQTLQATALVHEAWLRLGGPDDRRAWSSRAHFFGAAAEAMRRILVDAARRKARVRHGGGMERVSADAAEIACAVPDDRLLQVSDALDEMEEVAPEAARIVKLRYFAGMKQEDVAQSMGISLRSAERQWTWAKAWLFQKIRGQEASPGN